MLQRLEVWTDLECAGGTRLAFLPLDQIISLTTTERVTRDDEGTCELPKDTDAYTHIAGSRVLRLLYDDGEFGEWRIIRIDDTSRRSRIVTLHLRTPLMDLDGDGVLHEISGSSATTDLTWATLTPTQIVALILADAPSHWSAGTISPTVLCTLGPSGWTRLRALRETVGAIRKQGVAAELNFRRDGTTGYLVDIVSEIGSAADTLDVRTAKNLIAVDRERNHEKYAAEVMPVGGGTPRALIDRAFWECTAKSGSTLTMQQPVTGGPMVAFDDQLNGLYLMDDNGDEQQITDSIESTQQIVVASATNITAGRWYRAISDSSGGPLIVLRKDQSVGNPSRVVEASPGSSLNFVPNPTMRDWSGTIPDDWTHHSGGAGGGTYTKETGAGNWLTAGQSLYMKNSNGPSPTANIRSPLKGAYIPTDWTGKVIYSLWIKVKKYGNLGTIRMTAWGLTGGIAGSKGTKDITASEFPINQWHRVDIAVTLTTGTNALQQFGVSVHMTAVDSGGLEAECYVDSAMVDIVPASGSARPLVEGCDPSRLWAIGNQHLLAYGQEPVTYRASFADLAAWAPDEFPYEQVSLGQLARVRDTDLDLTVSARVLEVRRNHRNPLASQITVSSRPEDLISRLTGILAVA